jgi:hypothetical protein
MHFLVEKERKQGAKISTEIEKNFTIMLEAQIRFHRRLRSDALARADFVKAAHHQVMAEAYSNILKNHRFATQLVSNSNTK